MVSEIVKLQPPWNVWRRISNVKTAKAPGLAVSTPTRARRRGY
jgi:hypothetical protein